ncbi:unnamed protein product [Lactuca virosa]|uniref:Uncharacterized protein n=1 Tax=Lactuca virosa TaxID=75947 RepID=A0AAU9PJZ9_9ASTR|nr:unnamed protein product [Lactuca virosa]
MIHINCSTKCLNQDGIIKTLFTMINMTSRLLERGFLLIGNFFSHLQVVLAYCHQSTYMSKSREYVLIE